MNVIGASFRSVVRPGISKLSLLIQFDHPKSVLKQSALLEAGARQREIAHRVRAGLRSIKRC